MSLKADSDILSTQFVGNSNSTFKKYLPISDMDHKWGFTIKDVGHNVIKKHSDYPSKGHPNLYMFSWEKGRILNEHHFVLITSGEGIFESKSAGTKNISAGDGIIISPGEWHRYKPLKETEWTEYWVGFSGIIPDIIMKEPFFSKEQPIVKNCSNMLIMNLFNSMIQLIEEEPYGFQRISSGICLQLMAEICNISKGHVASKEINSIISQAKYLMQKKINENIDFNVFSKNHGISHSKFRFDFKKQTGFAPMQYFLLLKIEKAKDLLQNTNLRSKQIAFDLGFESEHYFCRFFKQKTGLTPMHFRMKSQGLINPEE